MCVKCAGVMGHKKPRHLNNPEKWRNTKYGVVNKFHYRLWDKDLASLEIGWLDEYELVHGERPPINKRGATT